MYLKSFEVRWSDMDVNRHLANSAYVNFMSHTRVAYFDAIGISQKAMVDHDLSPVIFYEHIYYLKEIMPGPPVRVSLEFMGLSEDGMFFEFYHDFYDQQGKHLAHGKMMGGWINSRTRKLCPLAPGLLAAFSSQKKAEGFRKLTRADTRPFFIPRKDLA